MLVDRFENAAKALAEAGARSCEAQQWLEAVSTYEAVANSCSNLKQGEAATAKLQEIEEKGMLGFAKNCPRRREKGAACDKHKKRPK